jgi:putative ATPase
MDDAREARTVPVPFTILDQTKRRLTRTADDGTPLAAGDGKYEYPHDRADGIGVQDYLGVTRNYYRPTDRGLEQAIREHLERIRATRRAVEETSRTRGDKG